MVLPANGEVFHFSEDPTILSFVPHIAATATDARPYVWAVDTARAPDYWFPRQCPRAMAWMLASTSAADRELVLGPGTSHRVHAVEYGWLDAIIQCKLFVYRLPAEHFVPIHGDTPYAFVSEQAAKPLWPPEPVGDLLALHQAAGIELRVLDNLWPWWDRVITTSVGFSGIRLANARPR
jgi:hypothetical protein